MQLMWLCCTNHVPHVHTGRVPSVKVTPLPCSIPPAKPASSIPPAKPARGLDPVTGGGRGGGGGGGEGRSRNRKTV